MAGFLDKTYGEKTAEEVRRHYDDWSGAYDAEITGAGYATPGRVAAALIAAGADPAQPILDFGCGTGVSGAALRAAGFTLVDGVDLSPGMLAIAREKGLYRTLSEIGSDAAPPSGYAAVAAIGVFGLGSAPPEAFERLVVTLEPGALFGFSLNDIALAKSRFPELVGELVSSGRASSLFEEHGPHLPGIGLGSTVYVLRKR